MTRRRLIAVAGIVAGLGLIVGGWFWLHRPVTPHPSFTLPKVERLLVFKSERRMLAYAGGKPVHTFEAIQLGDSPEGQKHFEGDERTPEGHFVIDGRNPNSAYHLSLRISYPDAAAIAYAQARSRAPGGNIFIHGQPNMLPGGRVPGDWTDGCIAVSNDEIEALWLAVNDGTPVEIRP